MISFKNMRTYILISLTLFVTSGCSTYPSKFKCNDARGLGCTMLDEIDRQIDSGKIEEVYKNKKDRKCCGNSCYYIHGDEGLTLKHKDKASKYKVEKDDISDDENNIEF